MANYGDVALGLKPDWSRTHYEQNDFVLGTVGHENGTADVYLKDEPDKEHQFRWVDWRDANDVTRAQMEGYGWVKEADGWIKADVLWMWDGEGFLIHAQQRLMARPKERWLRDQKRRDALYNKAKQDAERETEALPKGLIATDDDGRPLRRRKKGI